MTSKSCKYCKVDPYVLIKHITRLNIILTLRIDNKFLIGEIIVTFLSQKVILKLFLRTSESQNILQLLSLLTTQTRCFYPKFINMYVCVCALKLFQETRIWVANRRFHK